MKSNALILLIFFISTLYTHAAEQSGPTLRHASNFTGSCDPDPDGMKFAAKACYTNFDPDDAPFGSDYRPPQCDDRHQVSDNQRKALAAAFARAPKYAQDRLCRLTNLFVTRAINEGDWNSWGLWEGADRPPGTGVYVAISDLYLTSKQSFPEAENRIVEKLLRVADGRSHRRLRIPRLRTTAPTDPELTILGVLAHELGHVVLADGNVDGTDPRHPRRKVSDKPDSDCFEHDILDSWDSDAFHQHMRRWVVFGDQNHNRPKNLRYNLNRLRSEVRKGKLDAARDVITEVYRSGEFISFFAAISPEEDFVETYRYKVISDAAGNQPVTFRLRGREINVFERIGSGRIADKVNCLQRLHLLDPLP